MSKFFKSGDTVYYKKRKEGTRREAKPDELDDDGNIGRGYIEVPGKEYTAKGKIGQVNNLHIPVKLDEDGTMRQIPYSMLTPGYASKVSFQEKLPNQTEWEGEKLVVKRVGKTITVKGKAILDELFIPIVEADGHIAMLQVRDLKGVTR